MGLFDLSFWQSFISNLCATVIGVGLGIPVALWINRLIGKSTEKERKKKVLRLLHSELQTNLSYLANFSKEFYIHETGIYPALLRDELWRAFSDGGELEWIKDISILSALAEAYYMVRNVIYLAEKEFDITQFGKHDDWHWEKSIRDALIESIESGQDRISRALDEIENGISLVQKDKP